MSQRKLTFWAHPVETIEQLRVVFDLMDTCVRQLQLGGDVREAAEALMRQPDNSKLMLQFHHDFGRQMIRLAEVEDAGACVGLLRGWMSLVMTVIKEVEKSEEGMCSAVGYHVLAQVEEAFNRSTKITHLVDG